VCGKWKLEEEGEEDFLEMFVFGWNWFSLIVLEFTFLRVVSLKVKEKMLNEKMNKRGNVFSGLKFELLGRKVFGEFED
jgi:hypothetical protein